MPSYTVTDPATGKKTTYTVNTGGGGSATANSPSAAPTGSALGVPSGYKAPTGLQTESTTFAPGSPMLKMFPGAKGAPITAYGTTPNATQYTSGDQWGPISDPQSIPQLQAQLVQAGLLSAKSVRYGTWDSASANAYSQVLGFANAYGLNATQALQVLVSNPKASATAGGSGGSGTAAATVFTNPQDVATEFQNVSQNLTGQEQPTAAFQSAYQGQEAAAQHQKGTNYTRAPSLTGAATQYLINNDPSQVQAYGAASRMQELYSMLGIHG